jgi:3-phenylpropionate/trans-cinnamate dioxygenase ferredoxin subunit
MIMSEWWEKSCWRKVDEVHMLPPGSTKKIEHDGQAVLVANVGGRFCAIANACPHQGGNLSRGEIVDEVVACPRHGARFDLRTGQNLGDAHTASGDVKVDKIRSYPVLVNGYDLLVAIGPDPDLNPVPGPD